MIHILYNMLEFFLCARAAIHLIIMSSGSANEPSLQAVQHGDVKPRPNIYAIMLHKAKNDLWTTYFEYLLTSLQKACLSLLPTLLCAVDLDAYNKSKILLSVSYYHLCFPCMVTSMSFRLNHFYFTCTFPLLIKLTLNTLQFVLMSQSDAPLCAIKSENTCQLKQKQTYVKLARLASTFISSFCVLCLYGYAHYNSLTHTRTQTRWCLPLTCSFNSKSN